ncbi:MAG: DNA mismatch repair endonuclease MutL [Planctomycetaceae bacterium]|nr:DNA mismatch repair endonuclease MutL [Planctomycetaceae bacterium]
MSSRILQLDPHVVNRIAAGEVIERPASVVKELMENSVDAMSTRIEVDILTGGTELIRISDNGEGMHPDDLLLAVTSHATSKIRSDSDLQHVSTLGFRGEALASVASVSRFRIRTRREGMTAGRELECDGGSVVFNRECGCPQGTVIEVHNLFFNTPARRKFLKKASTEFGHISEQFARIALPNPNLHLVLRHNEKLVYEMPATASQSERIRRFFGGEVSDKLIQVDSETQSVDGQTIRVWGYVGEPSLSRGTRKDQYLFLNGRCIHDRSLQHALGEAYRGLLMVGRFPVSFLFLEVPPSLVDVNVHPTKTEVRFQDSQSLYRQLLHTLRDRFLSLEFSSELQVPVRQKPLETVAGNDSVQKELDLWADRSSRPVSPVFSSSATDISAGITELPRATGSLVRPNLKSAVFRAPVLDALRQPATDPSESMTVEQTNVPGTADPSSAGAELEIATPDSGVTQITPDAVVAAEETSPAVTEAKVLSDLTSGDFCNGNEFRAFQIHDCYLVVAGDDGLEVIDQHALHERILYEHLRNRVLGGSIERQKLLIPETIDCSAGEAAVLVEYQDLLSEIGFEIQEFGGTTILLSSHPVMLPRGNFVRILRDLAEQLQETDGKTSRRDLLDRMLHTMACRAAIKSGQRLAPEEMQELLKQRHLVHDAHHCPHGRPTSLILSRGTLDRQFGRLG